MSLVNHSRRAETERLTIGTRDAAQVNMPTTGRQTSAALQVSDRVSNRKENRRERKRTHSYKHAPTQTQPASISTQTKTKLRLYKEYWGYRTGTDGVHNILS